MTVSLEEARTRLDELIAQLAPGEEVVIASNGQPVAVLSKVPRASRPCRAGSAAHRPHWMAPDFDAPPEDFRESME